MRVCFLTTYLLFGNIFELLRAFCIFFFLFFVIFVNYSLNLDEDTLHRNTVAARKEPIMTISETFTCIVACN